MVSSSCLALVSVGPSHSGSAMIRAFCPRAIRKIFDPLGLSSPEAARPPPPAREVLRATEHGDASGVPAIAGRAERLQSPIEASYAAHPPNLFPQRTAYDNKNWRIRDAGLHTTARLDATARGFSSYGRGTMRRVFSGVSDGHEPPPGWTEQHQEMAGAPRLERTEPSPRLPGPRA
jgi:hypothetical protein